MRDAFSSSARWPGREPTVLALHGFTGTGGDFAPLAERLPYAMVAPDLAGHGQAAAVLDLAAHALPRQAEALAPGLDAAPWLLGYSLGARLALTLAVAHPERVAALVLIGGSPGLADADERAARMAADTALAARALAIGASAFLAEWARVPIIRSQLRIAPPIRAAMAERRRAHTAAGLAASLCGAGLGVMPSLWDALPTLQMPTLLVTGAEDAKFGALAVQMAARLPKATHAIVPAAGHCVHLEQPAATAAAIAAFFAEVEAR